MKKGFLIFFILLLASFFIYKFVKKINLNSEHEVGEPVDSLNHVIVYFNGGVDNNSGRTTSPDGYNIGIKYQCVEFVKRYYYQHLNHKMPDAFGNAKDFFDPEIADGIMNDKRGLIQYTNGSKTRPRADDLLIFSGSLFNKYGHVAIIASVNEKEIEIIQQNPGPFGNSRELIPADSSEKGWTIHNERVLGWLRKK